MVLSFHMPIATNPTKRSDDVGALIPTYDSAKSSCSFDFAIAFWTVVS